MAQKVALAAQAASSDRTSLHYRRLSMIPPAVQGTNMTSETNDSEFLAVIPVHWEANPEPQLNVLREEVARQTAFSDMDSGAFMTAAFDSIQRLPRDQVSGPLVEVLIDIAGFSHWNDQEDLAFAAATQAVERAALGGHRTLEARARLAHGTILKNHYQFGQALQELALALEIARAEGDVSLECKIVHNIGSWYFAAGLYTQALETYADLAIKWQREENPRFLKMALSNAAVSALRIGNLAAAMQYAEDADLLACDLSRTDDKLYFAQHAVTYCQLLVLADRTEEATARAKKAHAVATSSGCPRSAHIFAAIANGFTVFCTDVNSSDAIDQAIAAARKDSETATEIALDAAIRVFEHYGWLERALALQYERLAFQRAIKFSEVHRALGQDSSEEALSVEKIARLEAKIDRKLDELISVAVTQSVRSGYDQTRIFRVGRLAESFSLSQGWAPERAKELGLAAKLIDVGMMALPTDLLVRRQELAAAERRLVQEHARFGADLLHSSQLIRVSQYVPVVRFHHERWDGAGPNGLKEDATPLDARMVALCDCFDALTHNRPWRSAFPFDVALQVILEGAGSQFDPHLAAHFADFVRLETARSTNLDEDLETSAWENNFVRTQLRVEQLLRAGHDSTFV